jgi:hypothetical protein
MINSYLKNIIVIYLYQLRIIEDILQLTKQLVKKSILIILEILIILNIEYKQIYDLGKNIGDKTLNPSKIFYPNQIYDIFFLEIVIAWINILKYINDPFNNRLHSFDACRYALLNNIKVIDISRCICEIYRDEYFKNG